MFYFMFYYLQIDSIIRVNEATWYKAWTYQDHERILFLLVTDNQSDIRGTDSNRPCRILESVIPALLPGQNVTPTARIGIQEIPTIVRPTDI